MKLSDIITEFFQGDFDANGNNGNNTGNNYKAPTERMRSDQGMRAITIYIDFETFETSVVHYDDIVEDFGMLDRFMEDVKNEKPVPVDKALSKLTSNYWIDEHDLLVQLSDGEQEFRAATIDQFGSAFLWQAFTSKHYDAVTFVYGVRSVKEIEQYIAANRP